jgi:hypothetical protein
MDERDDYADPGRRLSDGTTAFIWVGVVILALCGALMFAGWFVSGLGVGD